MILARPSDRGGRAVPSAAVPEHVTRRIGWWPRLAVVAVLAAVIAPAVTNHDSFPLSTYPMYASARSDEASFATAVAVDGNGESHRLSLRTVARTDDPLIAESLVRRAIVTGEADALCVEIARRVAQPGVAIEVVDEQHDVVARAAGEPSLLGRTVHARCEAPQ
jgi:hypothetical protein